MQKYLGFISVLLLVCSACVSSQPVPAETRNFFADTTSVEAAAVADILDDARRQAAIARHLKFEADDPDGLIIHDGYVIQFNEDHKTPNWTLNEITPAQIAPREPSLERPGSFRIDPQFDADKQVRHTDYSSSGFDRGHFTPAGDFRQDKALKDATFLVTNIGPQTPDLNQRIWRILEDEIRTLVIDSAATAHVVTGAIYASKNAKNRGVSSKHIGIASSFYKIVYLQASTSDYVYAFLIPHMFAYDMDNPGCYQVTVDEIEQVAEEDFLDGIPDDKEQLLEAALLDVSNWLEPCSEGQ